MKTVHKSVLIWYSPQQMYGLVTDVNQYPAFLPWCSHAKVLEQDSRGMLAEIGIALGGVRQTFVTRNTHTENSKVQLKLVQGPFSSLEGEWNFSPVGDGSQRASRVELSLNYGFSSATLGKFVGPVFDRIAANLMDAFVKRAQQVFGE